MCIYIYLFIYSFIYNTTYIYIYMYTIFAAEIQLFGTSMCHTKNTTPNAATGADRILRGDGTAVDLRAHHAVHQAWCGCSIVKLKTWGGLGCSMNIF